MGEFASRLDDSAIDKFDHHMGAPYVGLDGLPSDVPNSVEGVAATEHERQAPSLDTERLSIRLMRLLEILPGAVLVIDGAGTIRECNSVAEEMLSTPLLGCAWSAIVNREFCRGASHCGELKHSSGRWFSLARRELGTEPGEILLLADITESRRTANLLQRSDRLSQLGEMSARLSHQIRTPLASALLYGSKMCDIGTPQQQDAAQKIVQHLREMGCMVNDMLRFASGTKQSGNFILVAELLQEIADDHAVISPSGSDLIVETADKRLGVFGNRDSLKGAISNLIVNAWQAGVEPTVVQLSAVKSNANVCITVADNGPGVDEAIRHRLFEPFFTTRPQGTGLGLAVVRSVAEAHAGEVLLDCGLHGTAFSICLPGTCEEFDSDESDSVVVEHG